MQHKKIKEYLAQNLDAFAGLSDSVFKGNYKINGKIASVYLIDFSNEISEEYLSVINDKFLTKEYYGLSGDLQWNLYYLFVRESIDEILKVKIENDKSFARKLVLNENSLVNYFGKITFEGNVERGIYDVWKDKLETSGLGFVGDSSVTYVEGTKRIGLGQLEASVNIKTKKKNQSAFEVKKVTKLLDWDKKRLPASLPTFGKVNLISGPNAIGKTSLLEFIEMGICGASYRNLQNQNTIDLKINFNDGTIDSYQPSDKEKYKNRDVAWYNSASNSRSNTLVVNFGRYNFYDADAAYRMSHEIEKENDRNSQRQLMSILSQLALGKEMNDLEVKVAGYLERIGKDLRTETKTLDDTKSFVNKHKENLKSLVTKIFDEDKAVADIIASLQEFGWKYKLDDYTEGLSEVSSDLLFILESLSSFLENGEELDISDIESLDKKDLFLKGFAKKLSLIEDEVSKKQNVKKKSEKDIAALKHLINKAKPFIKILTIDEIFNINNLLSSKENLAEKIEKIEHANSMYILGVDEISEEYYKESFVELKKSVETKVSRFTKELKDITKEISTLEEKEGVLQSLKEQIKRLGIEFLESNPEVDECPMCSTQFTENKLRDRIIKDISRLSSGKEILEFNKKKKRVEENLKEASYVRSALEGLYDTFIEVFPDKKIVAEKVGDVKAMITKQFESVDDLKLELKKTSEKLNTLKNAGATKESLTDFDIIVSENLGLSLSLKNRDEIVAWIHGLENRSVSSDKELLKLNDEINVLLDSAKSLFKAVQLKGSLNDKSSLSHAQQVIKDLHEEASEISKYFLKISNFKVLKNKIASQKERCDEFVKSKRDFEKSTTQKSNLENEIKKYEKSVELLNKKVSNLTNANSVLRDLQDNHGKADALNDFFDKNIKSISDTYLRIHSPKEFCDLTYDHTEQALFLKRIDTEEFVSVSQMSSGQRAALALSVFLTLNQNLTDGPKVILFDDPVIFADDLNVLSFFDYLRNLSNQGGRQIFFATANEKIASLFRRKFRVFGDDFVDINLEPTIDDKILTA